MLKSYIVFTAVMWALAFFVGSFHLGWVGLVILVVIEYWVWKSAIARAVREKARAIEIAPLSSPLKWFIGFVAVERAYFFLSAFVIENEVAAWLVWFVLGYAVWAWIVGRLVSALPATQVTTWRSGASG